MAATLNLENERMVNDPAKLAQRFRETAEGLGFYTKKDPGGKPLRGVPR
jgi:hypothetical protein